jgi:hypothetical protein
VDVVARVDGRRDDRATTIDVVVVVVVEDVDGRDGAKRGDDDVTLVVSRSAGRRAFMCSRHQRPKEEAAGSDLSPISLPARSTRPML